MADRATYAALLTPRGRGAVATVLVAGPAAVEIAGTLACDSQGRPLVLEPAARVRLARWGHAAGEEIVLAALDRTWVEIHCHGGSAAPRAICDALVAAGCTAADWATLLPAGASELDYGPALGALAQARTERTAMILLDQVQGAWVRELGEIARQIAAADWPAARATAERLLARRRLGAHLTEPWRVVLAGPPNVGKSSLINALVGYERAIVYDAPGTTRDVVTAGTAIDGWPVELCDTAGLRASREAIEAEGVALARRAAAAADVLLLVFSNQEPWRPECRQLAGEWPAAIAVYSKCDLGPPPADGRPPGVATSALTRAGLAELERAIAERCVPDPPPAGSAVPLDASQVELIERLLAAIGRESIEPALARLAPLLAGPGLDECGGAGRLWPPL